MKQTIAAALVALSLSAAPAALLAQERADRAQTLYDLAQHYASTGGAAIDVYRAAQLLRGAADLGHAPAQLQLGQAYLSGVGVMQSPALGFEWVSRAAHQGNAEAMLLLADLYYDGIGVRRNLRAAIDWEDRAQGAASTTAAASLQAGLPELPTDQNLFDLPVHDAAAR